MATCTTASYESLKALLGTNEAIRKAAGTREWTFELCGKLLTCSPDARYIRVKAEAESQGRGLAAAAAPPNFIFCNTGTVLRTATLGSQDTFILKVEGTGLVASDENKVNTLKEAQLVEDKDAAVVINDLKDRELAVAAAAASSNAAGSGAGSGNPSLAAAAGAAAGTTVDGGSKGKGTVNPAREAQVPLPGEVK